MGAALSLGGLEGGAKVEAPWVPTPMTNFIIGPVLGINFGTGS